MTRLYEAETRLNCLIESQESLRSRIEPQFAIDAWHLSAAPQFELPGEAFRRANVNFKLNLERVEQFPRTTTQSASIAFPFEMSAIRLSRAALRARAAAAFKPVQRRGYADAVSDKIKLSLSLPHQVCYATNPLEHCGRNVKKWILVRIFADDLSLLGYLQIYRCVCLNLEMDLMNLESMETLNSC